MLNKIKLVPIVFMFIFALILSACGSSSSSFDVGSSSNQAIADYASSESLTISGVTVTSADAGVTANTAGSGSLIQQKLIYKGDLNIETKEFDQTINTILLSLDKAGGYIVAQEDSDTDYAQYTSIEVRIPSQSFYTWVEGIEGIPNIKLSKRIFTEDVSEEYVDIVARLEAKQLVIDKYLEYMQLATTADELIRFTNELAHLQAEVEAFQARIEYLDHQVDYSSLTLHIKEIAERPFIAELNIGSTIKNAFENGITGFIAVLGFFISTFIVLLPVILLGGIIWLIVYFVRRSLIKNRIQSHSAVHESKRQIRVDSNDNSPSPDEAQQQNANNKKE